MGLKAIHAGGPTWLKVTLQKKEKIGSIAFWERRK